MIIFWEKSRIRKELYFWWEWGRGCPSIVSKQLRR